MKIRITFKDPDAVWEHVKEMVLFEYENESKDFIEYETSSRIELLSKWIIYGEYVTICFDTDKNVAEVVERNDI